MSTPLTAAIEAAGKNNFTFIAFLFFLAVQLVARIADKEKTGARVTMVLSVLAVLAMFGFRVFTPTAAQSKQTVTLSGSDQAVAAGDHVSATVQHGCN
jgi:hypothetical protein